jgi:hypothetical protein
MSNNNKPQTPQRVPPPAKDGIRTRFDPITEAHLRAEAKKRGISVQQYVKELAIKDRFGGSR